MKTIKFSHYYMKMPAGSLLDSSKTELFQVFVCNYKELGEKYKAWDTAYKEGEDIKFYPLPKEKLIVLILLTSNERMEMSWPWQTIRPWNSEKEKYYRSLIDQEVKIEIV